MKNIKVVLTGGPCAGKTTILNELKKYYETCGYNVITIPESATELLLNGIRFANENELWQFQNFIFEKQMLKEKIAGNATSFKSNDKPFIILCDRGIFDNKAYIDSNIFDTILEKNNCNYLELLDDYDLVIDLMSTAVCKPEVYTLASNEARTESIEEASILDRKTTCAWLGHDNLKLINTSGTIEEEIDLIKKYIYDALNNQSEKMVRRFVVDCDYDFFSRFNDNNSKTINVIKYYLNNDVSSYKQVLSVRSCNGNSSYYRYLESDINGIVLRKQKEKMSESNFYKELTLNNAVDKTREKEISFYENYQVYKLHIDDNKIVLEIEKQGLDKELIIPDGLYVLNEISSIKNNKVKFLCKND